MSRPDPVQPGSVLGILGGGQLGRMAAAQARRSGYRVAVFTEEPPGSPAGQWADVEINAPYDDRDALDRFLRDVAAVTMEFENLPSALLEEVGSRVRMRPGREALEICQNREREKRFLERHRFPLADFAVVANADELTAATARVGYPCVLKTAAFGYDGKGQQKLTGGEEPADAWAALGAPRGVLERWVDFQREISVVCARADDGTFAAFPPAENFHGGHILEFTLSPARIPPHIAREAVALARAVAEALRYTGTLAVEMFLTPCDNLLVNEIAPRPHNSGHHTIESCLTSQFSQQVRVVAGLPPGDARQHTPAVMANLPGDVWPADGSPPDWSPVLRHPRATLHLYGKARPALRRKMGHFTILADSLESAFADARSLRSRLLAAVGRA